MKWHCDIGISIASWVNSEIEWLLFNSLIGDAVSCLPEQFYEEISFKMFPALVPTESESQRAKARHSYFDKTSQVIV